MLYHILSLSANVSTSPAYNFPPQSHHSVSSHRFPHTNFPTRSQVCKSGSPIMIHASVSIADAVIQYNNSDCNILAKSHHQNPGKIPTSTHARCVNQIVLSICHVLLFISILHSGHISNRYTHDHSLYDKAFANTPENTSSKCST